MAQRSLARRVTTSRAFERAVGAGWTILASVWALIGAEAHRAGASSWKGWGVLTVLTLTIAALNFWGSRIWRP